MASDTKIIITPYLARKNRQDVNFKGIGVIFFSVYHTRESYKFRHFTSSQRTSTDLI